MRHSYFGKKLSRTKNERRRLFQGLVRDVITHGEITTTIVKAKAVQPLMESLITKAKRGSGSDRLQIMKILADKRSIEQLLSDAKKRFAARSSGYTRIIRLGVARGDGRMLARLQLVDPALPAETIPPERTAAPSKKLKETKKQRPTKRASKSATK